MTEAFASAVTVTVPILALATGAEARAIRDRVRRPDEEWERAFADYQREHELDVDKSPSAAIEYLLGVPGVSKAFVAERLLAVAGAVVWLAVFVLLAITEVLGLVWLGDGARGTDPGLATFAVVSIGLALGALILAPAVYLMMPLLLPLDLVPHGLKKAVGPKIVTVGGRDVLRHMLREFPAAVEKAAEEARRAAEDDAKGTVEGQRAPEPPAG